MPTSLVIMRKDLRRRLRSPLSLIVFLAFPFVFSGLMAVTFGGANDSAVAPRFSLALVNSDTGYAGSLVAGALKREELSRYFEAIEVDSIAAMELIHDDAVGGALMIPDNFSESLLNGVPAELLLIKNPAASIAPMAIEELSEMIAMACDGIVTVFGEPLARVRSAITGESGLSGLSAGADAAAPAGAVAAAAAGAAADAEVADISILIRRTIEGVGQYVFPPLIRLEETDDLLRADQMMEPLATDAATADSTGADVTAEDKSGFLMVFQFVLPGMGTFALIVLSLGFLSDIPRERSLGTLARQMTSPVSVRQIIAGKLLAAIAMGLLMALGMALIGGLLLKIRADLFAFLALCVTFIFGLTGFLLLFFAFTRSESSGSTYAWIVMMAMSVLGGTWIPLSQLPPFVSTLAKGTLNYWVIEGFTDLFFRQAGLAQLAPTLLLFLCVGGVGSIVGSWALERRLTSGV